jgi:hypothetical protein
MGKGIPTHQERSYPFTGSCQYPSHSGKQSAHVVLRRHSAGDAWQVNQEESRQ